MMWYPISEIAQATAKYVVVASPRGMFLQEREAAKKAGQLCWAYFCELPELPSFTSYVLREGEYEVLETEGEADEK